MYVEKIKPQSVKELISSYTQPKASTEPEKKSKKAALFEREVSKIEL